MTLLFLIFCSMCVVTEAHTVMNTLPGPVTFQGVKIGGENQTVSITVKTSVDMADAQGNKTHFNIPANALASNSVVSINPGRGQRCNLMLYPSNQEIFGE
jgi:hypothetical protein